MAAPGSTNQTDDQQDAPGSTNQTDDQQDAPDQATPQQSPVDIGKIRGFVGTDMPVAAMIAALAQQEEAEQTAATQSAEQLAVQKEQPEPEQPEDSPADAVESILNPEQPDEAETPEAPEAPDDSKESGETPTPPAASAGGDDPYDNLRKWATAQENPSGDSEVGYDINASAPPDPKSYGGSNERDAEDYVTDLRAWLGAHPYAKAPATPATQPATTAPVSPADLYQLDNPGIGAAAPIASPANPVATTASPASAPVDPLSSLRVWAANQPKPTVQGDWTEAEPPDPASVGKKDADGDVYTAAQYNADVQQYLAAHPAPSVASSPPPPAASSVVPVGATGPTPVDLSVLGDPNAAPAGVAAPGTAVTPATPTQPQPLQPTAPTGTILQGNGLHHFIAVVNGSDIQVAGNATVFGGPRDSQDNSLGEVIDPATGNTVTTHVTEQTLGVALPMHGANSGTTYSPLPQLPPGTQVRITANGKSVVVPLIDTGPTYTDGGSTGVNGSVALDMTPATARALGLPDDPDNADAVPVSYTILGGANYVTPDNVKSPIQASNEVNKADFPVIQALGNAIYGGKDIDFDTVDELASKIQSGAFQKYIPLLGGYADNLQNINPHHPDTEMLARAQKGIKTIYNAMHTQYLSQHQQ